MAVPKPTPIFRFLHIDNLPLVLQRGGLHAANFTPKDKFAYKTIHNTEIQQKRSQKLISCGPRGVIHDYVSFYFGYLSPMMLQLHTGRVASYDEGQEPLIYLVSTAQVVEDASVAFVFSDGHGIAAFTNWFDDLAELDKIDWTMVYQRYWADKIEDMDRQRRKQAEFLVHKFCDWSMIQEIAVISTKMKTRVERTLKKDARKTQPEVTVHRDWYY